MWKSRNDLPIFSQFSLCAKMISMNGTGAIINKIIDLHFARSHTRSNPWQKSVKKSPRLAADLPKSWQQFATSLCILPGVTPLAFQLFRILQNLLQNAEILYFNLNLNFPACNLPGAPAICVGFAPGISSDLKLQFARGFPGITPGKFARSFSSWHFSLAKCRISSSVFFQADR